MSDANTDQDIADPDKHLDASGLAALDEDNTGLAQPDEVTESAADSIAEPEPSAFFGASPRLPSIARFMTDLPASTRRLERWGMNPEDRARVMEQCLLLRKPGWKFNFGLMMLMSVIVAIMGLSANSAAVVIGAMLMAPLMTPVLGIAASLAMALGPALARSLATVLVAASGAVLLSYCAGWFLPDGRAGLSAEIMARTQPDVRDLFIALAAGVAGSYATARPDTSSSLPGVAIAVALVPPLAVIGLTLEAGETTSAQGALLLFVTNLAAIVAASAVVFLLTGFVPGRRFRDMRPSIMIGGVVALGLLGLVSWQLTETTLHTLDRIDVEREVGAQIEAWLDGTGDVVDSFSVDTTNNRVTVQVSGPTPLPPTRLLEEKLTSIIEGTVAVNATRVPVQTRNSGEPINVDAVRQIAQGWIDEQLRPQNYEIGTLDITDDSIRVGIPVRENPPDPTELEKRLRSEFGVESFVEFRERPTDSQPVDARLAATGRIRAVAESWAATRDGGRIDDLVVDFDEDLIAAVELTYAGPTEPSMNSLEEELWLREGFSGPIRLYYVPRQLVTDTVTVVEPTPTPDN